jgi:hypothetical protein
VEATEPLGGFARWMMLLSGWEEQLHVRVVRLTESRFEDVLRARDDPIRDFWRLRYGHQALPPHSVRANADNWAATAVKIRPAHRLGGQRKEGSDVRHSGWHRRVAQRQ